MIPILAHGGLSTVVAVLALLIIVPLEMLLWFFGASAAFIAPRAKTLGTIAACVSLIQFPICLLMIYLTIQSYHPLGVVLSIVTPLPLISGGIAFHILYLRPPPPQ